MHEALEQSVWTVPVWIEGIYHETVTIDTDIKHLDQALLFGDMQSHARFGDIVFPFALDQSDPFHIPLQACMRFYLPDAREYGPSYFLLVEKILGSAEVVLRPAGLKNEYLGTMTQFHDHSLPKRFDLGGADLQTVLVEPDEGFAIPVATSLKPRYLSFDILGTFKGDSKIEGPIRIMPILLVYLRATLQEEQLVIKAIADRHDIREAIDVAGEHTKDE